MRALSLQQRDQASHMKGLSPRTWRKGPGHSVQELAAGIMLALHQAPQGKGNA